jgi:threonine synthase
MKTAPSTPIAADHLLRCVHCQTVQVSTDRMFRCSSCSELLEIAYPEWADAAREFGLRLKELWRERRNSTLPEDTSGVWRFRDLLPRIERKHIVSITEGNTPLVELPKAARDVGIARVLVKHQGLNPTGSFKDTGVSMAISMAKTQGYELVCCASTGNTSASVAAYAARAGMKSIVLLPQGQVASGKLAQALEYGAHVLQLETDFDGCLKILHEVVLQFPAYLMNSLNPYRLEGQKTLAFELMEQLNWKIPDHVIVPGGNLANSSAIGKGFLELQQLGLISRLPKVSIIQAEGANPLVRSMRQSGGEKLIPVTPQTRATAIRIGNPASWRKAVAILNQTAGACEEVTEQEIATSKAELGAQGMGCEPASAASFAGLKKLAHLGFVKQEETAVLVLTGHMLKDVDYMLEAQVHRMLRAIPADAAEVVRALGKINAEK